MTHLHQSPVRAGLGDHRLSAEEATYFAECGAIVAATVRILGPMPQIKNRHGGRLIIGDQVVLNSDSENSNSPIPTPVKFVIGIGAEIVVGPNCDFNGCSITAYRSVIIGERVQIGAAGFITDTDLHPTDIDLRRDQLEGRPFPLESVAKSPVVIEDDVWIGYGVLVLKGVTIGAGSIIGAGSVVTRSVPPRSIAAGNPARVVKRL